MFTFFVLTRLCSSELLLSASTYFIVRVLSCVICILPRLAIPLLLPGIRLLIFSYFSGGVFCCDLVHGTLQHFIYLYSTLIILRVFVFLCLTVTTEFGSQARMNQERQWGYCRCCWVETTRSNVTTTTATTTT